MKIIVVTEYALSNNNQEETSFNSQFPVVLMKADSTLLKDGKPLFVPHFTQCLVGTFHVAVRICRLGKSIPRRFAHRYYDAVTVALDVCADDVRRQLSASGLPWDNATQFDGSTVVGDFVETQGRPLGDICLKGCYGQSEVASFSLAEMHSRVDELVERLSVNMQLRQGDLLLCGAVAPACRLDIGGHVHAELNGVGVLDFNVR